MNSKLKFEPVKIYGFEISETSVQDIDTEDDWKMAEMKYKFKQRT